MNFDRYHVARSQEQLNSRTRRRAGRVGLTIRALLLVAVLGVFVLGCFVGIGMFQGILDTAPDISRINVTPTGFSTFVYDTQGNETAKLVSTDANRIPVTLSQVPENLQHAFVAIEDERFYEHDGIDIQGIIRAGVRGITTGNFDQGASTITQQLLKNNVFTGWTDETFAESVRRKIQEQYLAVELEKTMSKDDILINYLNTINLGHNTLGVQAASQRYFDKDVSTLTLSECAVIAGITQNPTRYDPIVYPENNSRRRALVLKNMLTQGWISQEEYDDAMADDVYSRIKVVDRETDDNEVQSYFVDALTEQILEDLQKLGYTETQAFTLLYSGGLQIYSTQDPEIQAIADKAVSDESNYPNGTRWLLQYSLTVQHQDGSVDNYSTEMLRQYFRKETPSYSLLYDAQDEAREDCRTYRKSVVGKGDTVAAEHINLQPQPQISLTIEDQHTGNVVAMVGGRGSKTANRTLNRAYSTYRQPGSTFKVVSTYAPALDAGGFTLASTQDDAPFTYKDGVTPVRNWYGEQYRGLCSVREGIQDSLNIVAVKTLTDITPELGYSYLQDFGFTSLVDGEEINGQVFSDVQQTLALGGITKGVTNMELNAAYATIANGGEYLEPKLYSKITDHDGNIILNSSDRQTRRVLKKTTAWLLTSAMEDVVTKGTGSQGAPVDFGTTPIAGKTGTTEHVNDEWFAGYTSYYCATVWAGYDDNTKLVGTESRLAKIIWRAVMEEVHKDLPYLDFVRPEGIVEMDVCKASGKLPMSGTCEANLVTEYFDEDMVPRETCDVHGTTEYCEVTGLPAVENCPFKKTGRVHNASIGITCPHTESFMEQADIDSIIEEEKAWMESRHQNGTGTFSGNAAAAGENYTGTQYRQEREEARSRYAEAQEAAQGAVDSLNEANSNLQNAADTLKAAQDAFEAAVASGDEAEIQKWTDAVNDATGTYHSASSAQQLATDSYYAAQSAAEDARQAAEAAGGNSNNRTGSEAGNPVQNAEDSGENSAQNAGGAAAAPAADAGGEPAAQE